MPSKKTTKTKTEKQPEKLPLNREKRENLIKWWREQGWTYEKITAKFAEGVTEAEYEEAKAQWEA